MNKLIEKAKYYRPHQRRKLSPEEIELAVAWVKGEVSYSGVYHAVKLAGSNIYNFLASALREAYLRGMIK